VSDKDPQLLKAAPFTPQNEAVIPATVQKRLPNGALIGLAVGIIALAAVVFILPNWVDAKKPATDNVTPNTAQGANGAAMQSASKENVPGRSPFAEAQESQARRQAQAALEQVLELQALLQDRAVMAWGEADYQAALAIAELGDAAYRDREFSVAISEYERAAAGLAALEESIPARIDATLTALIVDIEAGDSSDAQINLDQLIQLAPGHPERPTLTNRVAAIPAVNTSLSAAHDAAAADDFTAAVEATKTALTADPAHIGARKILGNYQKSATDARFRRAMSKGYVALDAAQFDVAETAFKAALAVRAGAPEPTAALIELATARTAATLKSLQRTGKKQEQGESWQQALATYQQAMQLDANVVFAKQGIARSQPRAELATALKTIVAEQARLIDPRVIREADATLLVALQIEAPGPVLAQQIAAVQAALDYAKTPVQVALRSDGVTDVTLLRVKRLGPFENTALTLRPGRYTAVGVRTGFRDVRIEFDVAPNSVAAPVYISCSEAI
tara:strand:- start:2975 stop:4495 length:1521 start_codon:yes stop_codon:yes gene_type:complete